MAPQRHRLDLIYFNAGGGHRATAVALDAVIRAQQRPWDVRCVNLFEVLDPRDLFRRLTGMGPEDLYNGRLKRGWTLGLKQELKVFQAALRLTHATLVKRLQPHWAASRPDLVVSLIPNFNRALYASLGNTLPGVPYVTVLTDLADHPPNFWIEVAHRQHYVCGTPQAVAQARRAAHPEAHIHATSGMILRPDFYAPLRLDRAAERHRHGLDPQRPVGLVLFGGHGSRAMLTIARRLPHVQLILICGHNQALARQLRAEPAHSPRRVVEFTSEIPYYMQLADFFIGKPGPGSLSEAVQQGLPVVVVGNAWTMPQERYNLAWVRENGVGVVHASFRTIDHAVDSLLDNLDAYRAAARRLDNQALFEVPDILADILAGAYASRAETATVAARPAAEVRAALVTPG